MNLSHLYEIAETARTIDLNELLDKNIKLAFRHSITISEEGTIDRGDTPRILSLVEDYIKYEG